MSNTQQDGVSCKWSTWRLLTEALKKLYRFRQVMLLHIWFSQ